MTTSDKHVALRDDFEVLVNEEHHRLGLSLPTHARSIANMLVHLVVLHGLLPETGDE